MRTTFRLPTIACSLVLTLGLGLEGAAAQQLSPAVVFPGDATVVTATGRQEVPAIAAGGPGFLAVWEDQRGNLAGFTGAVGHPAAGNMTDIYGARFDASGNLLDTTPIVIANQGMNQTDPQVAWNGTSWLVVFVTERPDWYFFSDIVGVRVAADGTVLDPVPIPIRPESGSPSNDYGEYPSVTSNGSDWLVVWEAYDWTDNKAIVQGARVSGAGIVLDPAYRTLYKFTDLVFGPEFPKAASLNGEYLVVWDNFGPVKARRFDAGLNPLSGVISVPNLSGRTEVASGGSGYLLVSTLEAARLDASGAVLDTTPIQIPSAAPVFTQSAKVDRTKVAWNGTSWGVTYSIPETGSLFDDPNLWLVRVAASGAVVDASPLSIAAGDHDERSPVIAGSAGGDWVVAYEGSNYGVGQSPDVEAVRVAATGLADPAQDVSRGLTRQEHLSWCTANGAHLAVFTSKESGQTRILAQRFDDAGVPLDQEPVLLHLAFENVIAAPSVAWNGAHYLVTWLDSSGLVVGRRLTPSLGILGFGATPLLSGMDGAPSVAALGADFLVAAQDLYSSDLSRVLAVRVSGSTGAPIDATPLTIAFNYSYGPLVSTLGGNWLVGYTRRGCHDCNADTAHAQVVAPGGGLVGGALAVSGPGEGVLSSIAATPDRVLFAYVDPASFLQDAIEARILMAGGSFLGGEIAVADPPGRQLSPSAAWDGSQFVVAWSDYRQVTGVEQLRADVYAARVTSAGGVVDVGGGFPVATGVLPEDFPAVVGGADRALIGYLAFGGAGGNPEVQRLHRRVLGPLPFCQPDLGFGGPGSTLLSVCGDVLSGTGQADLRVDSPVAGSVAFLAWGFFNSPVALFGGTVVPVPYQELHVLPLDAFGDHTLAGLQSPGVAATVYAQAAVFDPSLPGQLQLSNAVQVDFLP